MKIKVCGLKYADNIADITALSPDYIGFICYDRSPRFIDDLDKGILQAIPTGITKTAVFVNEAAETISELITRYGFDAIQLHGTESPDFCEQFKGKVVVIKAFGVDEAFAFEQLRPYLNKVDYFMFDTKTPVHGGSGKTFDWAILTKYKLNVPFFLSGGLSADNIEEVKSINHPMLYALDLNSKFETAPALKDIDKLTQAFNTIKIYSNEIRS
ncbi:phosphoribosylanthranilate isomerase [Inquilinus sp. KBS0705]|nr:phosphoribosylanthranilate isomerase [Inquilinus sp. KBS0705]